MILELRGTEVWLTVSPFSDVDVETGLAEIVAGGYDGVDEELVRTSFSDLLPRAVGTTSESKRPGVVLVHIADDGMSASVQVVPPGDDAEPLVLEDLRVALAAVGVVEGIDEAKLAEVSLTMPNTEVVAEGWEPVDGHDGHIEYLVDVNHEIRPEPREDGGVDLRAVATIPDVREGDLLANVHEPTEGIPGRTVLGESIKARTGRKATVPSGKNIRLSDDGTQLHAGVDGLLEIHGNQMVVRPDLVIPGDVDFESGSVDFHGDVIIRGSVMPEFRVKSGGRLVIMGDVDQAEIEAASLVWVRGAVVGADCVIRCGGDVKVRTVHEARIEARGSVFVEREAQSATIMAAADVIFEHPRNRLVGGTTLAGYQVIAAEIGAVGEVPTYVAVGSDPFTAEEIAELQAERAEHTATLERMQPAIQTFLLKPDLIDSLPEDRRDAVQKLMEAYKTKTARAEQIDERLQTLETVPEEMKPRIVARLAMRPGVTMKVRRGRKRLTTAQFRLAAVEIAGAVEFVPIEQDKRPTPQFRA
ncbi:MAG: DUF342 domain-containing protein [Acidobacteria bacterium]|nr:DUF342 domain-containing protein [Acidobacteriota bacterium]